MPIAASTDSSARRPWFRARGGKVGIALRELGPGLRDGEGVAELMGDEAGESRQPATLVLLLADVAEQQHRAAAGNRGALDVDDHVAARTSGCA